MARIHTENGDAFQVVEGGTRDGGSGVHLEIKSSEFGIDTETAYLLTSSEARRIATALTTMANKIDAK